MAGVSLRVARIFRSFEKKRLASPGRQCQEDSVLQEPGLLDFRLFPCAASQRQ